MELRIHHFIDIIRDFGIGKTIAPHPYGHSYHKAAECIREDPNIQIKIVLGKDDVCNGCSRLVKGYCTDTIGHRSDFTSKHAFNDHIDQRIIEKCGLEIGDTLTAMQFCEKIPAYVENIFWIYEGNDEEHTLAGKKNVLKGFQRYIDNHSSS